MPAYMVFIRESEERDPEAMAAYRSAPRNEALTAKLKPLAVYGPMEVAEGAPPTGVIVLEFPTMEDAKAWYYSPEYQAAAEHRKRAADYRAVFVEGFKP